MQLDRDTSTSLNLVNESDLTQWVKQTFFADATRPDIRKREAVEEDLNGAAGILVNRYIQRSINLHLKKYIGQDFLEPVKFSEDLSFVIKESMKSSSKVYKLNTSKIPTELTEKIQRLKDFLYTDALDYIRKQLYGLHAQQFTLDTSFLASKHPDFEQAIADSKWRSGIKKVKNQIVLLDSVRQKNIENDD